MRTIIRNNYDPHLGDYHERIVQDDAREKTWLFDCDGVYLDITAGRGDIKVVNELGDSETDATSQKLVTDELGKKQDTLVAGDNITIEGNVISAGGGNYTAGYGLTLTGTEFAANTSVLATQTDLAGKQDTLTTGQLAAVNSGIDSTKVAQIATNAGNITTINGKIPTEATAQNQLADKSFVSAADNNLQSQIDAISASSDVTDIVGTKAALDAYDTSGLKDNDIIKVLQDESQNDETTYYRWSTTTNTFTLIGEEGPYYTKSQADTLLAGKVDKVTGKGLSENDFTDADVTKLSGIEAGAEVNDINSISVNGTAVTPDANKNVALTIPEGITTLTTDDYDYPTTGTKNAVAVWDLDPGAYKFGTGGGFIQIDSGIRKGLSAGNVFFVEKVSNGYKLVLWTDSDASGTAVSGLKYRITKGDGTRPSFIYDDDLILTLRNTRAFTGTDGTVAGAKGFVPAPATTDAGKVLSANGSWTTPDAGVKTLTTADYNYPTDNPTSVGLWLLPDGIYDCNTSGVIVRPYNSDVVRGGLAYVSTASGSTKNIRYLDSGEYKTRTVNSSTGNNEALQITDKVVDNLTSTSGAQPLSAYQGKVLNDKIVGTTETKTIATTDWTALSSSDPYDYSATVTATATINANTGVVELLNDQPVLFGTYGFAIGAVSGQSVTIYSIGQPDASVSLKLNIRNL